MDGPRGTGTTPRRLAGTRLGLRGRVTATFALGALVLSAVLATMTYTTARHYFVSQREATATRQSYVNAAFVRTGLELPDPNVPQILASLDTIPTSLSVVYVRGNWYETDITVGQDALPVEFRNLVRSGTPATQRFELGGVPQLAVGVPIARVGAAYFEVFPLDDLDRTLRTLAIVLMAAAAITTAAGAIVGRWASGRALRPLSKVARAASSIGSGHLGARLEPSPDRDLSELASSFNRMADEVQARIEHEARFAADVNHELRSPLTTLMAAVGVLEAHSGELPERSRRATELVVAELNRFQRMVSDLLEISRFDAGAAELSLDEVQVKELVDHAVGHSGIPVHLSPDAVRLRVRVDKRRIERVIANLVENAASYAGGVTDLSVEASEGRLRLVVDDSGPGIPAAERSKVFDRFSRGSSAGRRRNGEGVGLGLALVAEHVRLHGGRVSVGDSPSGGARFVVDLPVDAR